MVKNIVLKEHINKLGEVVIEAPIMVKEDTISYQTDKFTNGKERKLKNILAKLPGMEVSKKGNVTVFGKPVSALLVDNKPFFGGNTKLGVLNIPADAVDKIDAIDNYNPVGFLKRVEDTDKMALNISLKEDKKKFIFGDIEAGKGNKKYYTANANLFYYAPNTTVNFIGKSNNADKEVFTFDDYIKFNGGMTNFIFNKTSHISMPFFSSLLQQRDVTKSSAHFLATSINQSISSKLDISGYGICSKTTSNNFLTQTNKYNEFIEKLNAKGGDNMLLGIGKLLFDYTPSDSEKWYITTLFNTANNNNSQMTLSEIHSELDTINVNSNDKSLSFNQNVEWHYDNFDNQIMSVLSMITYDEYTPNNIDYRLTNLKTKSIVPIIQQDILQLSQQKRSNKYSFNTIFKHFLVVTPMSHIQTTIGDNYQKSYFSTYDFQILDNGLHHNFNDFNNQLKYNFNDFFIGLHYRFKKGIITSKQGVVLHHYNSNTYQDKDVNIQKWVLLPNFSLKVKFNSSKNLDFNYNLKTNFSNIEKLTNHFYLQSYNSVFKGSDNNLKNELFHFLSGKYRYFSLFNKSSITASIDYTKKIKGYVNRVNFKDFNKFLSYQFLKNPYEKWQFKLRMNKTIQNVKYDFNGYFKTSKYSQPLNNDININRSKNFHGNISATTKFKKFPTIQIGCKINIGKYTSNAMSSKYFSYEPYIDFSYDFLEAFQCNFDFINYYFKSGSTKTDYQLCNFELLYNKENSPWTYKISGNNLTQTKHKQSVSFLQYLISDTKTFIIPRVIMLSISYKL